MYKVAVIKHSAVEGETDRYFVNNIVEFASTVGLNEMVETLEADYLIPVSSVVCVNFEYDPNKGIFKNGQGDRIYPPLTLEERLSILENKIDNNDIIVINDTPNKVTIEERIIKAIKKLCENIITNGFDYNVLGNGDLHYALSSFKQKDLESTYLSILNNPDIDHVLWRDESRSTKENYTKEQFINLYKYLMMSIQACKFISDILELKVYKTDIVNDSLKGSIMNLLRELSESEINTILNYMNVYNTSNKFEFYWEDLSNIYNNVRMSYGDILATIVDVNLNNE